MGTSAIAAAFPASAAAPDMVRAWNGVGTGCATRPVMGQRSGGLGEDVILPVKT